ncbi:MAG TPA: hypothetical protein PK990_02590 [Salinivirgaceae bacterium]|nr:hypothetical protein [Salinivirgaceae bacterium]
MKKSLLVLIFVGMLYPVYSQDIEISDEKGSPVNFGVDLYNRYVWRGLLFSDAPNIQPWISADWKGLTFMCWGSYATSRDYSEVDIFLSYKWNGLTIGLNDYFNPSIDGVRNDYSIWKETTTPHLVEAYLMYKLPVEKFPFEFTASTFVYGADRDENLKNRYSTYVELLYPFVSGSNNISLFAGATVNKGYYATKAAFVNVGGKFLRNIKVTQDFEIPLTASLIFHPENRNVFLVVGFSF